MQALEKMDEQLFKCVVEEGGRAADIRTLVTKGAHVNAVDHAGWSPLHWACRGGPHQYSLARVLVIMGASVNSRNSRGQTPLHIAASHGCLRIGCLLLDHGAYLNARDDKGETPLSCAKPNSVASGLVAHKKELDKLVQTNEQLLAVVGSRNRKTYERLVRDENEQLKQQIEALRQRMDQFEHPQQHQQQQHQAVDHAVENGQEPTRKRQKIVLLEDPDCPPDTTAGFGEDQSWRSAVARCEERMDEQQTEMAALREEMGMRSGTSLATAKVKMEEEEPATEDENSETHDGGDTSWDAAAGIDNDAIADLQQELQRARADLQASQEAAHRYKTELDDIKTKMNHLHQLTG